MGRCGSLRLAALAVALVAVCGSAQDLKTYQGIYEKNLAGLVTEQKVQARALSDKYLATLELLQKKAQKAGDLDAVLTVTEELGRVAKGEPLADKDAVGAKFAELKAVRAQYEAALRLADGASARKIADLTVKYDKTLVALQTDLTRKGRIDDATVVKAERDGLEARTESAWAKAVQMGTAPSAALASAPGAAEKPDAAQPAVTAPGASFGKSGDLYLVVDLSGGPKAAKYPISYLTDVPKGGWTDEYKTDKLVLRKIEQGTFVRGSPEDEVGRKNYEKQREVSLPCVFYIGVFEVTQRQWERVMGDWPSFFNNPKYRDARPVERVSYNHIRGINDGAKWPTTNCVDAASFMGKLQARAGLVFDLPTAM